ncbi:uncharacterized protein EV420DRAFT_1758651 [Desarmillaria tabescens]|uniref:Protein kinase domain-containing protein n=1 Tax=Armillaria tabescens TaxID=1929756 RepID=A0AA39U479_ARMTA|nr:uncharacterized protein EV420DRAFT_1758651 [Desarmillaria tabescens]KAK0466710.1 hypothetical protein EV420DRAFT_1758651 [Desarmillaria tabescens]
MTRSSSLETRVDIAKVAATAGEMAPFLYIKGLCGCVVLILETIQKADKNDKDLRVLAESIGKTIETVQNTVKEHGESSALRFHDVCAELQVYLTNLLVDLSSTRHKSCGFKRFLKTNKVSDTVSGYQERVRAIREDFLIRTAIDSRIVISDIKDGLKASTDALTSVIEMSQRHTMSDIDKHADSIYGEIHTWGVLQSKKTDKLSADVQMLKERGSYKGFIRDVLPGDIYLRDLLIPSGWHPYLSNKMVAFSDYSADVDNSNVPKIVRVYTCTHNNEQDVMRQFHIDLDRLIKLKHQNIAQVFGVCRSPDFTAIIFHGTTRKSMRNYVASLTATQSLYFHFQLFNDLESTSAYLSKFYRSGTSPVGWTNDVVDTDPRDMYINERGRIVLTELSYSYFLNAFSVNIAQHLEAQSAVTLRPRQITPDASHTNSIRDWNSLMRRTSLDKSYLIEIYDAFYHLIGVEYTFSHPPGIRYPCSRGLVLQAESEMIFPCMAVGKILVEPTEWAVAWNGHSMPFSTCSGSFTIHNLSVNQKHSLHITPRDFRTPEYYTKTQQMMSSWLAQASRLSLSFSQNIRGIDCRMHDIKCVEVCLAVYFDLQITPCYDPFQLQDTFMADSEYTFALSLTICEPRLDSQSNVISWPVIHWFCHSSVSNEISVEEVEALFGIQVSFGANPRMYSIPEKVFSTIVEINTMCGFDPALEGADVCEYFDLPRLEIFEDSNIEHFPGYEIDETELPVTVRDRKDAVDVTPVTHIRAEKEPSASRMSQNRLILVLIALIIVTLSLVMHLFMKV